MRIFPERLEHEAESIRFKADVLEKAALLLGALEAICNHPALKGRHLTCDAIKDNGELISGSLTFSRFVRENQLRKSWKNRAHNEKRLRWRHNPDTRRYTTQSRLDYCLE